MQNKVIDSLISYAKENDNEVKNVTMGKTWTCVLSSYCGVSMTYSINNEDLDVRDFGHLEEKNVGELSEYLRSWNLLEASIGLASINSIIEPKGNAEANGLDVALDYGKGKKIVMIGKFPGIQKFKYVAKKFIVLELNPFLINPSEGILPSTAAETVIEDSQVVIITATAIINKSIDRILELSRKAKAYVILIGPSTPMLDLMFDFGVDVLAGMKVNRPYSFINKIRQGCGMVNPSKLEGDISFIIRTR
ncbi:DUF364 domain-containing protein [Acidianus brierleyi]|uniref:Heavy-metal chelation domain-containing protein n=1 Tax=Acidianus brierleyi TaxID=41673 RepID=A0A2U9ICS8_9CREN|nr:DUF364 domain-containing protein [Acidianus brierleyi]AWR93822.1 hypothetical protein DFR85_03530 [Acidianus brierleyi]